MDSASVSHYSKSIEATNHANTSYIEYSQTDIHAKLIELYSSSNAQKDIEFKALEEQESKIAKEEYESYSEQASEQIKKTDHANNLNDKYALAAALYAIVLFIGSLSLLVKIYHTQLWFILFAMVIFVTITLWMIRLPIPSL